MTYANVVSTLALVLVVGAGGTAAAAALVPRNSVASPQIVNGAVKGIDVRADTLTGADVNESSLGEVPQAGVASGVVHGSITDNSFTPGLIGVVRGYAWMDSAGASATLNNGYVFNDGGGAVTSTRNSVGNYTVTFETMSLEGGHVQVTSYGGGVTWCKVSGWGSNSATVLCFDAAGAPTDSRFAIAMIE